MTNFIAHQSFARLETSSVYRRAALLNRRTHRAPVRGSVRTKRWEAEVQ